MSCFSFSFIVSLTKSAVSQQVQSDSFRTFEDWCKNKDVLNEDAKHTINVLLTKIRTSDCKIANEKLSGAWYIELQGSKIRDI
jgi:internalin A